MGIFCDLRRTFDCVNHDILTARLEDIAVTGMALNWVNTFLDGRSQYVGVSSLQDGKLRKVFSNTMGVTIGVPQGSVVAPMLFMIYVNNSDSEVSRELIVDEIKNRVSTASINLGSWLAGNSFHFNMGKTLLIQFHNPQKKLNSSPVDKRYLVLIGSKGCYGGN